MGPGNKNSRNPDRQGDPQLEDGFARIANEILEALARTSLTDYENRCIHFLWRKTYGWHDRGNPEAKKVDAISYSQWAEGTGIDRRAVCRTLKTLAEKHIVTKTALKQEGRNTVILWGFQKKYVRWDGYVPLGQVKAVSTEPMPATQPVTTEPIEVSAPPAPLTHQVSAGMSSPIREVVTIGAEVSAQKSLEVSAEKSPTIDNKDNIQKISVSRTPKLSHNRFLARMQDYMGFPKRVVIDPVPNPGKEAKFIKKMLARGFSEDEIFRCWQEKVDGRQEFVSMQWVNEDIGKRQAKREDAKMDMGPLGRYGGRSAVVRQLYRQEEERLGMAPVGFIDQLRLKTDEELLAMYEGLRKGVSSEAPV